jgi:hypothetical protein
VRTLALNQARTDCACAICCGVASLVASALTLNSIATVSTKAMPNEATVVEAAACGKELVVFMVCFLDCEWVVGAGRSC